MAICPLFQLHLLSYRLRRSHAWLCLRRYGPLHLCKQSGRQREPCYETYTGDLLPESAVPENKGKCQFQGSGSSRSSWQLHRAEQQAAQHQILRFRPSARSKCNCREAA